MDKFRVEVIVTMNNGRQCSVKCGILKNNCFSTMFDNIVKKGSPVPDYQGVR